MRIWLLATVLFLAVAACSSSQTVRWHGLSVALPEGWVVAEKDATRLSLANAPLGEDGTAPGLEAAAFFTREPGIAAEDWERWVEEHDATVEVDERFTLDGSPATRLVFTHDANGTVLREMVLVVPARELVVLFQPVVPRGSDAGLRTFERYRDVFDAVIASIDFGAPPAAARPAA